MKHWHTLIAVCIGCLIGSTFISSIKAIDTDSTTGATDFSSLQIFTYNSGITGFFDPIRARLYLYDTNLENCFMIRELKQLGEPLNRLQE